MNKLHNGSGKLELIIGCMYSGKSSTLLTKERQHRLLGNTILAVNHQSDRRYGQDAISSHDMISTAATSLSRLGELYQMETYLKADVLLIEEAQFFEDLYEFVVNAVEKDNKHVIVSGLDGDYNRVPYMQIIRLIPFADIVERKNALCIKCRDGTIASFSKRLVECTDRHLVGGNDKYIPVCRYHYRSE